MSRTVPSWLVAVVLGSTLLAPAVVRAAETPAAGTGSRHAAMMSRFQQQLGLTDDQMKAIQAVNSRYAQNRKQTWQALRQKQGELRQLALNGADQATIQAKSAEVAQLMSQSLALRTQSLQEISPILSQEQRDKLAQMTPGKWHRHGQQQPQGSS